MSPSSKDASADEHQNIENEYHSLKVEELRKMLQEMELDHRGTKSVLLRRLRKNKQRMRKENEQIAAAKERWDTLLSAEAPHEETDWEREHERRKEWQQRLSDRKMLPNDQPYEFYLCLDVEATCDVNRVYPHEIIELPVVVCCARTKQVVEHFHSYCRPVKNPILTDFCKNLTRIKQEDVDNAQTFPHVLARFERWLSAIAAPPDYDGCIFVTDTSFDVGKFLTMQFKHDNLPHPKYLHKWINARMIVKSMYGIPKSTNVNLEEMVQKLNLEFVGRPHSGLDDTRNVAQIACELMKRGIKLKENAALKGHKHLLTQ